VLSWLNSERVASPVEHLVMKRLAVAVTEHRVPAWFLSSDERTAIVEVLPRDHGL